MLLLAFEKYKKQRLATPARGTNGFIQEFPSIFVKMCTIGKTDIRSTYKFDDSYCQPKLFPNSIMIIIGLHADNKP